MFPMDFDKLTREAFAHVATDRNKWNPSGDLGPEAAAFLATDCGIPMVLFVEWPAGGTVRADVYAPAGKGGPSLWQCIRVADTRYVTLLYPLGETGGHLVAAKQAPIHTSSSSAYEAVMVERIRQDAKYGTADYADVDPTLTRQGDVASMPIRLPHHAARGPRFPASGSETWPGALTRRVRPRA